MENAYCTYIHGLHMYNYNAQVECCVSKYSTYLRHTCTCVSSHVLKIAHCAVALVHHIGIAVSG